MPKSLFRDRSIVIISIILAFSVAWFFINKNALPISIQKSNIGKTLNEIPAKQEIVNTVNPISLPTLMEKVFDGRELTLGVKQADNQYYTRYFITYKSGELKISGILNVPKGEVPTGGFPVLFLNHGHIDTSIYTNGRGLKREQDYLAKQGFAVLHSDYRNHAMSDKDPNNETNIRLGYIEDVINAVYAVKNSNFTYLSKVRFGMLGHSMGGGITQAVLVAQPNLIKAAVLYAPVSSDARESFYRWTKSRPEVAAKIVETYGSPENAKEFWDNMSPKTFFSRQLAPVLYFHGTNDKDVPVEWSRTTKILLQEIQKRVELVEYPGEAHEFGPKWSDFMSKSTEFFKQNLASGV